LRDVCLNINIGRAVPILVGLISIVPFRLLSTVCSVCPQCVNTKGNWLWGGFENLLLGVAGAAIAFGVGEIYHATV
jgi:hypothetical protein